MVTDVVCGLILLSFAVIGAAQGLVRQVFGLLALVLVAVFAVPLGVAVAAPLVEAQGWSAFTAVKVKVAAALVAAFGIFVAVRLVGRWVNRLIGKRDPDAPHAGLAPWNRSWGAALGVLKAALGCWLVLSFFTAFPRLAPGAAGYFGKSWSARTTELFNPFRYWIGSDRRAEIEDALVALWRLKRHPAAYNRVLKEESIQRVLRNPRLAELLDGEKSDLVKALTSEEFCRSLRDIDFEHIADVAREALAEAEKE